MKLFRSSPPANRTPNDNFMKSWLSRPVTISYSTLMVATDGLGILLGQHREMAFTSENGQQGRNRDPATTQMLPHNRLSTTTRPVHEVNKSGAKITTALWRPIYVHWRDLARNLRTQLLRCWMLLTAIHRVSRTSTIFAKIQSRRVTDFFLSSPIHTSFSSTSFDSHL